MNRWLLFALTLIAAGSLTGCVDRQAQAQARATQKILSDKTQAVDVATVGTAPVTETLEITGEVTTGEDADVGAKQSGKLIAVYVKDGDPVTAGELVAKQDTSTQQAQLNQAVAGLTSANSQLSQAIANAKVGPEKSSAAVAQARAQLRSAQANFAKVKNGARTEERVQTEWTVKQAQTNVEIAKQDLNRKQTLFEQGAIAKTELEQAQNTYAAAMTQYNSALQSQKMQNEGARPEDIAVAQQAVQTAQQQLKQAQDQQRLDVLYNDQVTTAKAAVSSAEAQVQVARQAISDSEIRAPFNGRVAGKPAQPGQIVGPGTTVARIIGSGGEYFEGNVPENSITRVRSGSPVSITITAIPGETFSGHVAAINPVGSDVGRLFTVRISFDQVTSEVKPGMFARGIVTLRVIPDAIMVPATSVVTYNDQPTVFVMNGTDGVKPLPVRTGIRKDDSVQIVSGLAPGEKLVVQGQENLTEKSKVKVEGSSKTADRNGKSETVGS